MSDALTRAQQLLALTAQAEPDGNALSQAAQELLASLQKATPETVRAVLERLQSGLNHSHPQVGGLVALTCGAILEGQNGDPEIIGPTLFARATEVFTAAARFVAIVDDRYPLTDDEDAHATPELTRVQIDGRPIPDPLVEGIWQEDAFAVQSWMALEPWMLPTITHLTRSKPLRKKARANAELFAAAEALQGVAGFLRMALRVLDDTELLVLHPETRQGYLLQMGGIADNFQLHILLADLLVARPVGLFGRLRGQKPVGLPGTPPQPDVTALFWGRGPQRSDVNAHGVWNLYDHRAATDWPGVVRTNGMEHRDHWVWGEGIPDDIPEFDGKRVVLLGEPAVQRTFSAGRRFDGLVPTLTITGTLSPTDVEGWMQRLAAAGTVL